MKEVYGFVTVEPKALADCPYKPGTEAHRDWISFHVLQKQTNPETDARKNAMAVADSRLAKLKKQYGRQDILDPEIDALINQIPDVPIIKPARSAHSILIEKVNETWIATGLGPSSMFIKYVPQIFTSPEFVTQDVMFDILRGASQKNIDEVIQQRGIIFYAVRDPNWVSQSMNNPSAMSQMIYSQVQVQYLTYRN